MNCNHTRLFAGLCVGMLLAVTSSETWAQANSLFGNSGPRNAASGQGLSSGSGGRTSLGNEDFNVGGDSGGIQGGLSGGEATGGFVGRTGDEAFVGARGGAGQAGQQGRNTGGGGRGGGLNRGGFGQGQFGGNNRGQFGQGGRQGGRQGNRAGNTQRRRIRPVQRIAFNYPRRSRAVVATVVRTRFERATKSYPTLKGVNVVLTDTTLTLRGEVESVDVLKLAAALARLEPGVDKVVVELTVASAGASE